MLPIEHPNDDTKEQRNCRHALQCNALLDRRRPAQLVMATGGLSTLELSRRRLNSKSLFLGDSIVREAGNTASPRRPLEIRDSLRWAAGLQVVSQFEIKDGLLNNPLCDYS